MGFKNEIGGGVVELCRILFLERRIPIRVKQLPWTIRNTIERKRLARKLQNKPTDGKIHFVFLSCSNHYKYLRVSLASLDKLDKRYVGKVYLHIDDEDPLTKAQIGEIAEWELDVEVVSAGRIRGWGVEMVRIELEAFRHAVRNAGDHDYIAKSDSDIVFISAEIFWQVVNSGKALIGDGAFVDYKYAQGGCYFLSKEIANQLEKYLENGRLETVMQQELKTRAEDVTISELVRREKNDIWLTKFMMFPREYDKAGAIDRVNGKQFSMVHFVQEKDRMISMLPPINNENVNG